MNYIDERLLQIPRFSKLSSKEAHPFLALDSIVYTDWNGPR